MSARCSIASRFVIEDPDRDLLGRGGMGEVYRATDTHTGETVAVKALDPEILARNPELLERFQREGEALRQLNHPNIVHMLAAVEEEGRHYLVMEYVGGGSLEDLIETQTRLPAQRVIEIALDLADALTRAHRLGIIHRDFKPANVLLAEDGTPRLADFGIAHLTTGPRLTQTGMLVGTLDYISPEICKGEPPDERSDIWSFGVMLFEMLSGQVPFKGENLTAKITSILTQPVPDIVELAPGIPDALADLVYRMLEKDPQQRIPSVRLVGAELEALLKGKSWPIPAHLPTAGSRFIPVTPPPGSKNNLPAQTTPFVGRETELVGLVRLLDDPAVRLVTIVGLGGMGKTRLAIEVGAREIEKFEGGVYFVSLGSIQSSDAIIPAIAQVIGFSFYESGDQKQQLLDYLRNKKMLLILDNFEHLLDGVSLANEIILTAPNSKVLGTSRIRLNLQTEHLFHLDGMDFPDWETPEDALEYSSLKLYLQGARKVRPGYELSPEDVRFVTHICRIVGGMPLAILLAAAWIEMLTPAEILAELQSGLDILTTDLQDVADRQRSIRSTLDYSWNLLSPCEQDVFRALAVFQGGFTREAAQEITGASLRDLMGLVNKSFLHRSPSGRYELHELLRQYGLEHLGRIPDGIESVQDRHCRYFTDFLFHRSSALAGPGQKEVRIEISVEIDNIKAAWDWAILKNKIEEIDSSLECLSEFYWLNGWYADGTKSFSQAAKRIVDLPEDAYPGSRLLSARALLQAGRFSAISDTENQTNEYLRTSLDILRELGEVRDTAYALCYLGGCEKLYGSMARIFCEEGLKLFRSIGDIHGSALALRGLGWAALHSCEYAASRDYFQESLKLYRQTGNQAGITTSLGALGYANWIIGNYSQAEQLHQEMLALCREIGDQGGIARALGDLGIDYYGLQNYEQALDYWKLSLALYREIGNPWGIADVLGDLGEGCLMLENYPGAIRFAQESMSIHQIGSADFDLQAWELRVIGHAYLLTGDIPNARKYLYRALKAGVQANLRSRALLTLIPIARLLNSQGDTGRALEYLFLVRHHPISWQMARDQASPLIASLTAGLSAEVITAAQERGLLRDLNATIAELLKELAE